MAEPINISAAQQFKPGIIGANILNIYGSSQYLNFGNTTGEAGFGIRNNAGNLEFKNSGGSWLPLGTGGTSLPNGTIAAFEATTCPSGWSEYTPARGRFLRGIDNSAGNDPDGNRAPGATQGDAIKTHWLREYLFNGTSNLSGGYRATAIHPNAGGWGFGGNTTNVSYDNTIQYLGAAETRPKNVAVIFCKYSSAGAPITSGGVTADGLTNYVARWTSSSAIGTGQIYDNGTAVAIGNTSPAARLSVGSAPGSANNAYYDIGADKIAANTSVYSYGRICAGGTSGNCLGTGGTVLRSDGVQFPDGTVQTSAVPTPDHRVSSCYAGPYETCSTTVTCAAGKKVTGGGSYTSWVAAPNLSSSPASVTSWQCMFYNSGASPLGPFYCYAVCI